jgi:ribosomal 50S subunit-associated protein YjgA (DUF615 family)
MRNSLLEIQQIDRYLFHEMDAAEAEAFRTQLLLTPELEEKKRHQQEAHRLLRWLGRYTRRRQLEALHEKLYSEENFRREITAIFNTATE